MDFGTTANDGNVSFEIRPGAGDANCSPTGYMYYSIDGSNWSLFWTKPNLAGWTTYADTAHIANNFRYIRANTDECSVDWSKAEISGPPDLTGGLVAYWSFNNCDATDDSGNGHNGMIYGNPQCVDGERGKAFSFNGVSDYIEVPNSSSQQISTNEMTVSAWIRLSGNVGVTQWRIAEKQQTREIAWGLEIFGNGYWGTTGTNINFHDSTGLGWVNCLATEINLNPTTWYHAVATDSDGIIKIYINGVLGHECLNGVGIPSFIVSPIEIARNLMENNFFFSGILDEVHIYNRALTEAEIQALYTEKVIIPYQATNYKYQIYSLGAVPANFGALDFDDSQFQMGDGSFGSSGGCSL